MVALLLVGLILSRYTVASIKISDCSVLRVYVLVIVFVDNGANVYTFYF